MSAGHDHQRIASTHVKGGLNGVLINGVIVCTAPLVVAVCFATQGEMLASASAVALVLPMALPFVGWLVYLRRAARMRITVAPASLTITFEHFRVASSFWPTRPRERFECRLEDILDVYLLRGRGTYDAMKIVTARGSIMVRSHMSHFEELRQLLSDVSEITPHGPFTQNPWFIFILSVIGVIVVLTLVVLSGIL